MGDLIERKALLEELKRYTTYDLVAVKTVERAQTVDAVPVVHGWWIEGLDGSVMCAICDELTSFHERYCPNCGAKMDGKK